jgi:hypothetical protein
LGSTGTRNGIASGSQLYIFHKGGSNASFNSSFVNLTLLAPIGFGGGVGAGVCGAEDVGVANAVLFEVIGGLTSGSCFIIPGSIFGSFLIDINRVAKELRDQVPNPSLPNKMMDLQQPSSNTPTTMPMKLEPVIKTEPIDPTAIKTEPGIKSEPIDPLTTIKKEPKIEPGTIKQEIDVKPITSTNSAGTVISTPTTSTPPIHTPAQTPPQPPMGANKVRFTKEELKEALEPPLLKMYNCEPEAIPFRVPVDPKQLNIPDYFEIIKKPMDMSAIKNKLETGCYTDPWEFVDDVWLMFENAWIYNRKTSRVYKYCTKLSEVFEQEIDPVMVRLGYCCGRKHTFSPQTLCCYGQQNTICTIPRDGKYYVYENRNPTPALFSDRYNFCQKCFNDIPGDTVSMGDDPSQPQK